MNVAYHLQQMGVKAHLLSRVGEDVAGDILLNTLKSWGLSTALCEADAAYPTSEVHARVGENHEVTYEIVYPVAWDFISYNTEAASLLRRADAFVFGSLATRNQTSRETLFRLLEESAFNVFDVNLRAPHYSPAVIRQLLHKTNLLKLNQQELELLTDWFGGGITSEAARIGLLHEQFGIGEIIVTRGSKGASYFIPGKRLDCAALPVEVADTVGSGDAFLAAFLAKKLQNESAETALAYAAALGALVTSKHGACPPYTTSELDTLLAGKEKLPVPAIKSA